MHPTSLVLLLILSSLFPLLLVYLLIVPGLELAFLSPMSILLYASACPPPVTSPSL